MLLFVPVSADPSLVALSLRSDPCYLLSRLAMAVCSGVHPPLTERQGLSKMQPLSKEKETKCGLVITHYKGWSAASHISR